MVAVAATVSKAYAITLDFHRSQLKRTHEPRIPKWVTQEMNLNVIHIFGWMFGSDFINNVNYVCMGIWQPNWRLRWVYEVLFLFVEMYFGNVLQATLGYIGIFGKSFECNEIALSFNSTLPFTIVILSFMCMCMCNRSWHISI